MKLPFGLTISRQPGLETKASKTTPLFWMSRTAAPVYTPRKIAPQAQRGYVENPIVNACVRRIAEAVCRVPVLLYDDPARDSEIERHPLLDLLRRPAPTQSWADFARAAVSWRVMTGNSFLELISAGGRPRELYTLRPDRMEVKALSASGPFEYTYRVNGRAASWVVDPTKAAPLWHWKTWHPLDDVWGLGSIDPAQRAIDTHASHQDHAKALLDNAATPSGAFVFNPKDGGAVSNGRMPDDMFDSLKRMVDERFASGKNAGRPMVLEGGLDWKQFGISPVDMDSLEGQREQARQIAVAFGVPPMLLSIPGDNTYSNQREANAAFARDTVLPMLDDLLSTLSLWLAPHYGQPDLTLAYDEDEIPALAELRAATWAKVQGADWITVNEKRAATGYDEIHTSKDADEHDQVLVSSSMTPLGMAPAGDEMADTGEDYSDTGDGDKKVNGHAIQ